MTASIAALTDYEITELRKLWGTGTPISIARQMHIAWPVLKAAAQQMGWVAPEYEPVRVATDWLETEYTVLRDLWGQGLSTGKIGERMGRTKNSVIGKARRLELMPRPSPIKRDASYVPPPRKAPALRPVVYRDPPMPKVITPRIKIVAPPKPPAPPRIVAPSPYRTCQWIDGHPHTRNYTFCGDATTHGSSYCAIHHRRCFIPLIRREYAA